MKEESILSAGISIVIPVYNEVAGVGELLGSLAEAMAELEVPWEVIVVDDGSTDSVEMAVAAELEDHASTEPRRDEQPVPLRDNVRLVRHSRNQGYGAAIKTGLHAAAHPWILITDADGTYPCRHIPELVRRRRDCRMVVGARIGHKVHIPWLRRPAKWVLRRLASYLSQVEILDLNSGLRLFPKELAQRFVRLLPSGFSFTSTLTLAALAQGYDVEYVPIDYRRRQGRSKIRPIRDTLGFLHLIVRTVMFFDPMRVLMPVSFFFILASVAVGVGSVLWTGELMDVTTVVLFVTGVQLFALGMLAEAVNRKLP